MIIDAHTHVHSLPDHMWDSPPERIVTLMDEAGIDRAVIMPYGEILPTDPSLLDYTIACVERFPDRLIGFARMHPAGGQAGMDLFERSVRESGIRGLKFHPVGTMMHPASEESVAFSRRAVALDLPILFHCGDEEWTLPFQIAQLMAKLPEAKVILGHMGGYFHTEDAIQVAERYPNCYLETSATPDPRVILEAIQRIGSERILFGSDGPGCLPALELAKIRQLELPAKDEALILGGNFLRLIGESA